MSPWLDEKSGTWASIYRRFILSSLSPGLKFERFIEDGLLQGDISVRHSFICRLLYGMDGSQLSNLCGGAEENVSGHPDRFHQLTVLCFSPRGYLLLSMEKDLLKKKGEKYGLEGVCL